MQELDEARLRELLPGIWRVAATNLPRWNDAERRGSTISCDPVDTSTLSFTHQVTYAGPENEVLEASARSVWRRGEFACRGEGKHRLVRGRWRISGASDDGSIILVEAEFARGKIDRLDVLLREGAVAPELRRTIALGTEAFGLTPERFATLNWQRPGMDVLA